VSFPFLVDAAFFVIIRVSFLITMLGPASPSTGFFSTADVMESIR
jgi:hypothetical protein